MTYLRKYRRIGVKAAVIALILLIVYTQGDALTPDDHALKALTMENTVLEKSVKSKVSSLPGDEQFEIAAESSLLQLKVDRSTGHFIVLDKRSGQLFRSYPDPEHWQSETIKGIWRQHLMSPVMYSYVQLDIRKDLEKESDFIADSGRIKDFKLIENGFRLTFDIPERGFEIPVQVVIEHDYVATTIVDDHLVERKVNLAGIKNESLKQSLIAGDSVDIAAIEDEKLKDSVTKAVRMISSLVSIRLYPFLGAEQSVGQDGYLMIPDGPGALIRFNPNRGNVKDYYDERIYGEDMAFSYNKQLSQRAAITAPVFGIKSGDKAFLAQVIEGEAYARILAAPSGSLSAYNWATVAQLYRSSFYQPTSTDREEGFTTFTEDRFRYDRVTRYYLLDPEHADYSGMAERYRTYWIEEGGMERLQDLPDNIPMQISLLGGGPEKGFLRENYVPATTTEQAKRVIDELVTAGIKNMSVNYIGWEAGGYGKYGRSFPVAGELGGNIGMASFIAHAHSRGISVYLESESYAFNNTGKGGFDRRRDGLRDLAGSIIAVNVPGGEATLVSSRFIEGRVRSDMEMFKALGADGLAFDNDNGRLLNSDFNKKHAADREEAKQIQQATIQYAGQNLGHAKARQANLYALPFVDHLSDIAQNYSYDLFVDETIPFIPMTLHGLVSYSGEYANLSDDDTTSFLRGMEYGMLPSFVLSYAKSQALLNTIGLNGFYSTNYQDWRQEMVAQYEQFNEALSDVQNEWIVRHRTLAEGVKETTYSNGKRIIVNYNNEPYSMDRMTVQGVSYLVIEGGRLP
ncbi:DUF5696 domain-containing protein [Cohnella yongneupensis]|uniref:DUF5696 domain-containing protein n=1 Tax=Cohnella yongneupensis TaxID=425006 RepID=A0ABW0R0D6_9BACL